MLDLLFNILAASLDHPLCRIVFSLIYPNLPLSDSFLSLWTLNLY